MLPYVPVQWTFHIERKFTRLRIVAVPVCLPGHTKYLSSSTYFDVCSLFNGKKIKIKYNEELFALVRLLLMSKLNHTTYSVA